MGFYIDAGEQRDKARRAEQALAEHSARRVPRVRPPGIEEYDPVESSLPPVFRKEGYYASARESSVDRRASRFRDGLPPPPPPDTSEIPRVLPPPPNPLMDQQAFDRQVPPTSELRWENQMPDPNILVLVPPRTPEPVLTLPEAFDEVERRWLSPSQKKRLRRKEKKLRERAGSPDRSQQSRPAPFPLPRDTHTDQRANGHAPVSPTLVLPTQTNLPEELTRVECGAEVLITMPDQSVHRLRCPLKPWPHPNQPHLVQIQSASADRAEIFVGFWLQGE